MKAYLFLLLLLGNILIAHESIDLPFYKETESFIIFCSPIDQALVNKMTKEGETFFKQLENDFKYHYNGPKIIMKVYPELNSLHAAMDSPNAPAWLIARSELDTIMLISPNNPGPYHTFNTSRGILKRVLTGFLMHNKYGEMKYKKIIPRWLRQGIVLYKNDYYLPEQYNDLIKTITSFPTLEQLEEIDQGNSQAFEKLNGIVISFSLVHFIEKKWGWNALLDLLDDYTKFESILNITKQKFEKKWSKFLASENL